MKCSGIPTPVTNKMLLQFCIINVETSREQSGCHGRKRTDRQRQDLPEELEGICQLWNVCNVFLGAG